MKPKVASSELAGPYSDDHRSRERSIMGLIDVEAEDLGTRGTGNIRERDFVGRDKNGLTRIWSITDSSP